MIGQEEKVSKMESPKCLATEKKKKQENKDLTPRGLLSTPSTLLIPLDPLTFLVGGHAV